MFLRNKTNFYTSLIICILELKVIKCHLLTCRSHYTATIDHPQPTTLAVILYKNV